MYSASAYYYAQVRERARRVNISTLTIPIPSALPSSTPPSRSSVAIIVVHCNLVPLCLFYFPLLSPSLSLSLLLKAGNKNVMDIGDLKSTIAQMEIQIGILSKKTPAYSLISSS